MSLERKLLDAGCGRRFGVPWRPMLSPVRALTLVLVLAASGCASSPPAAPRHVAKRAPAPAPVAKRAEPERPQGIHVARRCYCLARKGGEAEFALRLSADDTTARGVSIRVFPGASRDAILVKAPVVLHPKYEYVKFTIPVLPGVEDFQLQLNAKMGEQAIGEIVTERCDSRCDSQTARRD